MNDPAIIFQLFNIVVSLGVLGYVVRVEHRLTKLETTLSEHTKADTIVAGQVMRLLDRRLKPRNGEL
jgi:hypothetical protein